jgi:Heterokaryon incompatibility protein (HET)
MYVELLRATFVSVVGYGSSDAPIQIFAELLTFTIPKPENEAGQFRHPSIHPSMTLPLQMGNQKSIPERGLTYKKLDKDRNQIRLLKFQKRRRKNPQHLNVSLHTVSLGERPRYNCLSYFWGHPNFTWPIYVNGVLTHITPTLGAALSQLEHEEMEALWVDGICINQRDVEEREDQVVKMSQIYSGCVANFAWLGLGDKESYRAMHAINTIGARLFRTIAADRFDILFNQFGKEI